MERKEHQPGNLSDRLARKGIASDMGSDERIDLDPTVEEAYWREQFTTRPYYTAGDTFEDFGPAYRAGWESHATHPGRDFADIEHELGRDWQRARGASKLSWERAKLAVKDAWHRVRGA